MPFSNKLSPVNRESQVQFSVSDQKNDNNELYVLVDAYLIYGILVQSESSSVWLKPTIYIA